MTSSSHNSAASGDALTSESSSGDDNAVEAQPLALALPTTSTPAPPAKDDAEQEMTIAMKLAGSKRKRNLPGTPAPDAEVVALSPKTLMATHKFTCEVCGRGFQREQNLQLHKRGHNLPGSLKPRATKDKEVRKKVYVCPEETCVHHDPSRALGDLTGIKKHFCRKHGEKKWHCEKCSKRYAVLSDRKAHSKTCGTRDYKCECGNVFFRRDSFETHKAFCNQLAQESAKLAEGESEGSLLTGSTEFETTIQGLDRLQRKFNAIDGETTVVALVEMFLLPRLDSGQSRDIFVTQLDPGVAWYPQIEAPSSGDGGQVEELRSDSGEALMRYSLESLRARVCHSDTINKVGVIDMFVHSLFVQES